MSTALPAPYAIGLHGAAVVQRVTIDRLTDSADIARLAFRHHQISGAEPHVRVISIDRPVAPMSLLPPNATVERCVTTAIMVVLVAKCGVVGHVLVNAFARSATVSVSAPTQAQADALADDITRRAEMPAAAGTTSVRTWHLTNEGRAVADSRRIDAPAWAGIAHNYPRRVRSPLERLIALERPASAGKLLLWHGEPGTGKTTALRSLIAAWEPWCATQYIADPEQFFARPSYIAEVLTRAPTPRFGPTLTTAGDPEALWRLVIAEDTDEYLRSSARRDSGAALGRLLNLADGILGQGFNTLLLLTTNEEIDRLHPALTRPGRCLARIEFTSFNPAEANHWLPNGSSTVTEAKTLAELFEIAGGASRIESNQQSEQARIGQYL